MQEFKDMINSIDDLELLSSAEALLKDMCEIQNLKEKIQMLEDGLSKGKKAAFWLFAMDLDKEQIDFATAAVIGRRRFISDLQEKKSN